MSEYGAGCIYSNDDAYDVYIITLQLLYLHKQDNKVIPGTVYLITYAE